MQPPIESTARDLLWATLDVVNGQKVPVTDDIVMRNGAKLIDATYLYADLAGSTDLAHKLKKEAAAVIIKAYLNSASRILRHWGGEIRSFDGDRVMAIFMGENREWRAVRAALAINWSVQKVLRPLIRERWTDVDGLYKIAHGVGIDTGEALIVRGGVRNNSDLASVGESPNVAAKLSSMRLGHSLYLTDRVKDALSDDLIYVDGSPLWTRIGTSISIGNKYYTVFGSNGYWEC